MSAANRGGALTVPHNETEPAPDGQYPEAFVWLAFVGGLTWALYFLVAAKGVEGADPIGHFVISREAWHRPALMLHHWGRPINTLVYMPAAMLGLSAARVTSLVLAVLTALITMRLARRLQVQHAFVIPILLWFQPWFARWVVHPSLTENPFSLLMVLSAYLFVSGRLLPASLIVGLLPLTRIEAIALTGLWTVYCIWRREWRGVVLAILPVVVYAGLYRWVFGQLPGGDFPIIPTFSSGAHLLAHAGTPRPNWWTFVTQLLSGAGLPAVILALYGVPLIIRSASRLAAFGWYASYLMVHMVAFGIGFVAALGGDQVRYLFPIAPAVSIAAALGLKSFVDQVCDSLEKLLGRRARRFGWLIMAACIVVALAAGLRQRPTSPDPEAVAVEAAADWLRQQGMSAGPLVSTHVLIHYFLPGHLLPLRPGVDPDALWSNPPSPAAMPVGTVVVWDSHFSPGFGLPYDSLASSDLIRWRRLKTFEFPYERPYGRVEIFRKEKPWATKPCVGDTSGKDVSLRNPKSD